MEPFLRLNCFLLYFLCGLYAAYTLDVLSACHRHCVKEGVIADGAFDVVCNETCKIEKKTTDSLSKPWSLYCTMGCNFGITAYVKLLKDDIGIPPAPYLVAGSSTNDSVTIQWEPAKYANITYLVQWRNDDSHNKDWEYYNSQNPLQVNVLQVKGLHPYTKYRFRVAWILLPHYSPLVSEESFVISTASYGVPFSAPKITSLKAVGSTRVSVTWNRPTFPNGEIISYALSLREHLKGNVQIKDVSDLQGQLHYMFSNLKPQTTYIISISANNNAGRGPADYRNITTPAKVESTKFQVSEPYLLFATPQRIARQALNIVGETKIICQSSKNSTIITGLAFHMKEEKIFLSDSVGSVHVVPMYEDRVMQPILQYNSSYPTLLSVDWLNNKLYMVENKQISRCGLDGNYYKVIVKGFHTQPSDLHVDPYHGYLYWVVSSIEAGGLYRLDLNDVNLRTSTQREAQLILRSHDVQTFVIDHINFRILYPNTIVNTILSISLDGSDMINIRDNSQNPNFLNIKSLATHNNLFYWTNGTKIYGEEYHQKENKYYHNHYLQDGPFITLKIMHADSQPYPVPLNPVENLQVLFQDEMAKIFWSKPKLLEDVGKGAWQKWFYEVHLYDHRKSLTIFGNYTSANVYKIFTLTPNTTYSVKVRPCSPGGKGTWSTDFTGKTLMQNKTLGQPYIIWSTKEGIVKSDIVGENIKLLLHRTNLNNAGLTGIRWYQDCLFINTNTSLVYMYNISEPHSLTKLENISNAAGIALDWLAPKLYWSSPAQRMICRANLDGSQPESLPIVTLAQQLVIDSPSGHLYWSTAHSVEGSYLNGSYIHKYATTGLFSGKHFMGLALDFDRQKLYWMIRNYEGAFMYSAPMLGAAAGKLSKNIVESVGFLAQDDIQGPLWYFSDRLFWIHEIKGALVSDMQGKNIAGYKELQLNNLQWFVIVHHSLQPFPAIKGIDTITVVPSHIQTNDIRTEGTWNNFSIVWSAVTNVNYGEVFYDINLSSSEVTHAEVSREPRIAFPMRNLRPYTEFTIAIRAFTVWASSKQTVITLLSPMSYPSQPERPRIFIVHKPVPLSSSQEIDAEFRWSPPLQRNGIILGYRVRCWYNEDGKNITVCDNIKVDGNVMKLPLYDLVPNRTYSFQVQAFNDFGDGPYSAIAETITSHEQPIPKLLLAKTDAVKVTDLDTEEEHLLSNKATEPIAITYLARENKVFWLEEQGSLMTSQTDGYNTTLVRTLSSMGTSLTIDWIGRYLYWTEIKNQQSSIWMLDLNNHQSQPVLSQSAIITAIEVEPFSSKLIWSQMEENEEGHLKTSDTKGKNICSFFLQHQNEYYYNVAKPETQSNNKPYKEFCNCLSQQLVGKVIAIDRSNVTHPEVLWVDGRYGHIWASDLMGCNCRIVVNASESKDNGLPPTSITVDTNAIYWSNKDLNRIYSIDKESKPNIFQPDQDAYSDKLLSASQRRNHLKVKIVQGIRQIRAIGDHLQSYPDKGCLYPSSSGITSLINRTPNSLKLQLPTVFTHKNCSKISMATIKYSVYYGKTNSANMMECVNDNTQCKLLIFYAQNSGQGEIITIPELQSYTNYGVQVAVNNHYNKGKITLGPVNIFQTKEGVPHAPTNLSVVAVTPERIDVHWSPPNILNGKNVSYEVRWKMAGDHPSGQSSIYSHNSNVLSDNRYKMSLENLLPETKYYVMVRVYSSGEDLHNDSQEIAAVTYSLPHNLTLVGRNAKTLNLSWLSPESGEIIQHMLEMLKLGDSKWQHLINESTLNATIYDFNIIDLQPKTIYKTRLVLTYFQEKATFIWPKNSYFMFQTLGGSPDIPGIPHVRNIGQDSYQVVWTAAFPNGGDVTYSLEYSVLEESNIDEDWNIAYNGTNTHWLIEDLPPKVHYQFRVRAINDYGESDYSNASEPFTLTNSIALASQANGEVTIILVSTLSTILFITSFLGVVCYMMYRKHQKEKQIPHTVEQEHQNPDTELATLRELPLNGNFIHQNNALYSIGDIPTDEELATLPHIHREQIIVTKFLGSGAFGEVFEGIAHSLYEENEPPIKVAIKTLRKGATDQEKAEFLKEAKLMSNFKHEHILQLLGVCLNNNPNFIILELMEGGDLLTYLRSNRPSIFMSNPLTLDDLIAICVDVAKGCHCLEEMHFVHRDLAARNCLVSSHERSTRIVKIGDFGLARDIYKNDYYRKEGEGLLPVRWMAPESLVDGVFTSQSDVWAFGVLLWEVMTLGQQPYPARTNLEVLHYVRTGGRLDKPQNCPDDLHQLMMLCWSYCPEGRPTFEYCLETLKELRRKSNITHVDSVHNHNYLGHFHNGGIENLAYLEDDQQQFDSGNRSRNGERDLDTWSTCSDPLQACRDVGNVNKVKRASSINHPPLQKVHLDIISPPHITQEGLWPPNNFQPPKYLEILADSEDVTDADGYEMPLPPLPSSRKHQIKKPLQYAELARLKSPSPCPSNRVDNMLSHVTDTDSLSDLLNLSYAPICPKFILDFGDNKENIDSVNGVDRFYESGSERLHSPIITSALLKPKSSQSLNLSQQKLNSNGQEMDRWSVSTVSTVPCPNDISSDFDSFNHSGISSLSEVSGVELNYIPNSSWC